MVLIWSHLNHSIIFPTTICLQLRTLWVDHQNNTLIVEYMKGIRLHVKKELTTCKLRQYRDCVMLHELLKYFWNRLTAGTWGRGGGVVSGRTQICQQEESDHHMTRCTSQRPTHGCCAGPGGGNISGEGQSDSCIGNYHRGDSPGT